jgi:hypothetical protein
MSDRGIKWLTWLCFWPILIVIFLFSWLFPQSEEEAKKTETWLEGLRESEKDSLLFGETHRKY